MSEDVVAEVGWEVGRFEEGLETDGASRGIRARAARARLRASCRERLVGGDWLGFCLALSGFVRAAGCCQSLHSGGVGVGGRRRIGICGRSESQSGRSWVIRRLVH